VPGGSDKRNGTRERRREKPDTNWVHSQSQQSSRRERTNPVKDSGELVDCLYGQLLFILLRTRRAACHWRCGTGDATTLKPVTREKELAPLRDGEWATLNNRIAWGVQGPSPSLTVATTCNVVRASGQIVAGSQGQSRSQSKAQPSQTTLGGSIQFDYLLVTTFTQPLSRHTPSDSQSIQNSHEKIQIPWARERS